MQTLFADMFSEMALPALIDMGGQAITYSHGTTSIDCIAIVGSVEQEEREGTDGRTTSTQKRCVILQKSEVAVVSRKATLTIGTDTWAIRNIVSESESTTEVDCVLRGVAETAAPGFRRQG